MGQRERFRISALKLSTVNKNLVSEQLTCDIIINVTPLGVLRSTENNLMLNRHIRQSQLLNALRPMQMY